MVLATSTLMTEKKTKEKDLEQILYIQYFVTFKDHTEVLLDLESEINTMSQIFTSQLGLKI